MTCLCGHEKEQHKDVQGFYGPCTRCKACTHYAVRFSQVGRLPVQKEK